MFILETDNLTKYYGKNIGIKNINLTVSKGEIFGLIGPSGAGKSTIVNVLLNFIFPSVGNAYILGMDSTKKSAKIKKYIGYIPSRAYYYLHATPLDIFKSTISFYSLKHKDAIYQLSDLFNINLHKQISMLSKLDIKKISIILAFMVNPQLIIMEEPFYELDDDTAKILLELMETKNRDGMSIFITSQNEKGMKYICNRIAKIETGQITDITETKKENLSSNHVKKVSLSCKDIPLGILKEIAGNSLKIKDGYIFFNYSGDVGDLLSVLNNYSVTDLSITNSNLEEFTVYNED